MNSPNIDTDKPKPKRGRPFAKKSESAPPPAPQEFSGLTQNDCALACNVDRCVISGKAYCGHPYKGGLRHSDMTDAGAVKRMGEARGVIERLVLEARLKA